MSYTQLLKDFTEISYWNIDNLFNYFDLDTITRNTSNEILPFLTGSFFLDFIINKLILPPLAFLNQLIYFYYPIFESLKVLILKLFQNDLLKIFSNFPFLYHNIKENILNEDIFFKSQYSNSITLLQLPVYLDNKFFIGFLNSLFLSLPFSCNQLICFYRFFTSGPSYGIIATLGWILGQCSLIFSILFGFRPIIVQWFSLEPINYFFALFIIVNFLRKTINSPTYTQRNKSRNNKIDLEKINKHKETESIFAMHFILSWTETIGLFSNFSSFNFGRESTILSISSSPSIFQYYLTQCSYIFGIFIGCIIFSYIYNILIIRLLFKFHKLFSINNNNKTVVKFKNFMNIVGFNTLVLIIGVTIASISNFDVSYLLTNSLGFIPQDKTLSRILLNTNSSDPQIRISLAPGRRDGFIGNDNDFMYIDVFSFNDKEYKNTLEFEDINYQAEYEWMSRYDKFNERERRPKPQKSIDTKKEFNNHLIKEYRTLDVFPIDRYKNQKKEIAFSSNNNFIDENYLNNNTKFNFYKEIMDSNFKLDFIPYKKAFFAANTAEADLFEVQQEIKQKYYINTIYKLLLNFEVDSMISRQLTNSILLEPQEADLFKRRVALSNYYESNYYYSKMNHFDLFRHNFFNSKSYLNNIYNQQFNGTLRIVSKLFPISLNENPNERSILKFDYPLIEEYKKNKYAHEEIIPHKFNQFSYDNYKGLSLTTSSPLYITWNDNLNQLVITNNLILKRSDTRSQLDSYPFYLTDETKLIQGPMTLTNFQTLNNLVRNSYSIFSNPALRKLFYFKENLFYENDNIFLLDALDLEDHEQYLFFKLNVSSKPNETSLKNINNIDWYAFRYNDEARDEKRDREANKYIKYIVQETNKEDERDYQIKYNLKSLN